MEPARPGRGDGGAAAGPLWRLNSPDLLRVIIDSALAAVVTMGADGRISGWGAVAERTFGWTAEEAVGRRLSELIVAARYRLAHDAGLDRYRPRKRVRSSAPSGKWGHCTGTAMEVCRTLEWR